MNDAHDDSETTPYSIVIGSESDFRRTIDEMR